MKLDEELLALCLDVYEERVEINAHLPADVRRREARAAAARVLRACAPGAVAFIEKRREALVIDEVRAKGLRKRARPTIDAVLRAANVEADVSEGMLFRSLIPWVVTWRDQLCWRLSREALLSTPEIALVIGRRNHSEVVRAIQRYEARSRRSLSTSKEANGGT